MQIKERTKKLLKSGKAIQAINELTALLAKDCSSDDPQTISNDEIHYLIGNSYYKIGNWQKAILHYNEACIYNANSPAREKLKMTYNILEFYNKDIYGQ